jgi:DNA-binding transcriptional regulator YhcF (GntR family)
MRPPSAPPLHVAATGPRFQAIARAITDEIRRGVLVPGAQLPSSRALARALDVHRNTVLAALGELEAQGWITTQPARGTFVSDALPAATARAALPHRTRAGFALPPPPIAAREVGPPGRGVIALDGGVPDPRGFPVDALARAWRRVVRRRAAHAARLRPARGSPRAARGAGRAGAHAARGAGHRRARAGDARQPDGARSVRAGAAAARRSGRGRGPRLPAGVGRAHGWPAPSWCRSPVDGDGLDVVALARPTPARRCARSTPRRTTSTRRR